jgi:hypothetical protein
MRTDVSFLSVLSLRCAHELNALWVGHVRPSVRPSACFIFRSDERISLYVWDLRWKLLDVFNFDTFGYHIAHTLRRPYGYIRWSFLSKSAVHKRLVRIVFLLSLSYANK